MRKLTLWTLIVFLAILPSTVVFAQEETPEPTLDFSAIEYCKYGAWYVGLSELQRFFAFANTSLNTHTELPTCAQLKEAFERKEEKERRKAALDLVGQMDDQTKIAQCFPEGTDAGDAIVGHLFWFQEWTESKTLEELESLAPSTALVGEMVGEAYCYAFKNVWILEFLRMEEATVIHNSHLRSGIGETFSVVGGLTAGDAITVIATNAGDGTWYLVKANSGIGWIRYDDTNLAAYLPTSFPSNELLQALAAKADMSELHVFGLMENPAEIAKYDHEGKYELLSLAFYTDVIRLYALEKSGGTVVWVCNLPVGNTFDETTCQQQ